LQQPREPRQARRRQPVILDPSDRGAREPDCRVRGRTDVERRMKTIDSLGDLRDKRVLVRADFNVPLDGTTITDDGRIRAALPTITRLTGAGAKVVLMAHLGRPKGTVDPAYSLAPVAARLGELLGQDVTLAGDLVGPSAKD